MAATVMAVTCLQSSETGLDNIRSPYKNLIRTYNEYIYLRFLMLNKATLEIPV